MTVIPFIDWNDTGKVDPADIALSLVIAEEIEEEDEENDDDLQ